MKQAQVARGWLVLGILAAQGISSAQSGYTGPQAVIYIGDKWCTGGYCYGSTYSAFEEAMTKALAGSGYVRAIRNPEGASLNLRAGVNSISGSGGVCLPFVGCINGKTVRADMELTDHKTGEVKWTNSCEGTSGGFSTWYWWTGSIYLDSDEGKAIADCAGKMVQAMVKSNVLQPYLTLPQGAAIGSAPAPVQAAPTQQTTVVTTSMTPNAVVPIQMLGGALNTLAFADMNALFTGDPYNPVKVKELNAAATSATLAAAAKVKFSVTAGENAGTYQLVGLTYTLPDGKEKFVQLAVTSDPNLNPRGGSKIVYLSAYNPLRAANTALDGLSKNVETLLNDLHGALSLPGL